MTMANTIYTTLGNNEGYGSAEFSSKIFTNRTSEDVAFALLNPDYPFPAKGAYNAADLNRVGHNLDFLADLLNGYGYLVSVSPKTDWTLEDIPRASDMAQYLADLNALKDKFYGTTELPDSMNNLTVTAANNIEKLLLEIETYINRMVAGFRKCGTFKSGQGVILP